MKTRPPLYKRALVENPFVSEAQRAWMYANEPSMAKKWQSHTKKGKKLPQYKGKRKSKTFSVNNTVKAPNPLKIDPTRTVTLRRKFSSELIRLFTSLKSKIIKLVDVEDAFGLKIRKPATFNVLCPTGDGGEVGPSCGKRNTGDLLNVEQQHSYDCGVAALQTVFKHLDIEVDYSNLFQELGTDKRHGTKPSKIIAVAQSYGLKTTEFSNDSELSALSSALLLGPVICAIQKPNTQSISNVFCPTGSGGGVDPTCSPSASASSLKQDSSKMTLDERNAVTQYQTATFEVVNEYLRTGRIVESDLAQGITDDEEGRELLDQTVKVLDSATSRGTVPPSIVLYRGIDSRTIEKMGGLKEGQIVVDKGFTSTTLSKYIASGSSGALLTMRTEGTVHGVYSNEEDLEEVLLERGTKYRVNSVKQGKKLEVDVTIIGSSVSPVMSKKDRPVLDKYGRKLRYLYDPRRDKTIVQYESGGRWSSVTSNVDSTNIDSNTNGHWVVVTRLDPNTIYIQDSVDGSSFMPISGWLKGWHDVDASGRKYVQYGILLENGLSHNISYPTANTRWRFHSTPQKLEAFKSWLKSQMAAEITRQETRDVIKKYIQQGYQKGAGRAFDDVRRAELARRKPELFTEEHQESLRDFYEGTKDEFLRSSFGRPESVEKVELLASRTYDDLEGVTSAMATDMSRTLTDGLVQGKNPRDIARDLTDSVEGIGKNRANVIARTEIIRSHSEGQLDSMVNLGVEDVGVAIEWSTAGDIRVCEQCSTLEGVVLKIEEARGMIPRHPNCRCAWLPANVGEDEDAKEDQIRSKGEIDETFEEAGGDGPKVSKSRPESILNKVNSIAAELKENVNNVFCPTGLGGGVDPSCSPSSSKGHLPLEKFAGGLKEKDRMELSIQPGIKPRGGSCSVFGDCTNQAFLEYKRSGADVYHGHAVKKANLDRAEEYYKKMADEYGESEVGPYTAPTGAFPHAWNVKDGKIVDRALGSEEASEYIYFGRKIPTDVLDKMEHGDEIAKLAMNVFCSTGKGGGRDPTCSPAPNSGLHGGTAGGGSDPYASVKEKAASLTDTILRSFKDDYSKVTSLPVIKQIKQALEHSKVLTQRMFRKLENRYGRPTAIAIMASAQTIAWGSAAAGAAVGVPLYLPGSSLWGAIPGVAIAETYKQLSGGVRKVKTHKVVSNENDSSKDRQVVLSLEDIERLGKQVVNRLRKKFAKYTENTFKDTQMNISNVFCPTGPDER